jgi:hypothetical protein
MNDRSNPLNVNSDSDPIGVPVFNCVVYVSCSEAGVQARVANLDGLQFRAANERAALAQIVPAFKQRVAELLQAGEPIPWVDPIPPLQPGEEQRLIPVHL